MTSQMLRRYLKSSAAFLSAGCADDVDRNIQDHLWEKSTLAGMCAYLLHALATLDPAGAESIAAELHSFDEDGEPLADWVDDQLKAVQP